MPFTALWCSQLGDRKDPVSSHVPNPAWHRTCLAALWCVHVCLCFVFQPYLGNDYLSDYLTCGEEFADAWLRVQPEALDVQRGGLQRWRLGREGGDTFSAEESPAIGSTCIEGVDE